MRWINLSSQSSNFRADGSVLHWEFPELQFEGAKKLALSSMCLTHKSLNNSVSFPVFTNLINADRDNPDGIITCARFIRQHFSAQASNLEFWALDSNYPRDIIFTFPGIKAADFVHVNIVLVIE